MYPVVASNVSSQLWSVKCEYYEMVWWHRTGRTPCLYVNISWPESERRVGGQPGPAAAQWANWLGGGNRETSPASQADTTTRETLQVRPEGHTSHSVTTPDRTDTIQDTQTHHSQDHMPASSPLSPVQPPTLPPTTQSQLTVPTLPLCLSIDCRYLQIHPQTCQQFYTFGAFSCHTYNPFLLFFCVKS